jgi:hypothetical protein
MPEYATQHPRSAGTASMGEGIDVTTLFLTACASAAAAYTCSKIWAPGTLASAAFTPVLVAIIKEALAKPTQAVARAVPVRGVVRSAGPDGPQSPGSSWSAASDGEHLGGDHAAATPAPAQASRPLDDPATRVAQPGEIQYHGKSPRARGWPVAIVTGLLGFAICAVAFTVPELVAGGSATGGGRDTTLFGGGQGHARPAPTVTTTTTTPTQTVTTPPTKTVTVPPPAVTTTTPLPTATTTTAPMPPVTQTTTVPTTPGAHAPAVSQPPAAQPPG